MQGSNDTDSKSALENPTSTRASSNESLEEDNFPGKYACRFCNTAFENLKESINHEGKCTVQTKLSDATVIHGSRWRELKMLTMNDIQTGNYMKLCTKSDKTLFKKLIIA